MKLMFEKPKLADEVKKMVYNALSPIKNIFVVRIIHKDIYLIFEKLEFVVFKRHF